MPKYVKRLWALVLCFLLIGSYAEAQGPFSAQIQAALRAFLTQAHTWTATQTFANITVGGTCTGCASATGLSGTLTAGRIPYASGAQTVVDSANFAQTVVSVGMDYLWGPGEYSAQFMANLPTAAVTPTAQFGSVISIDVNPTAGDATGSSYWALQPIAYNTSTRHIFEIGGFNTFVGHVGVGVLDNLYGGSYFIQTQAGAGNVAAAYGLQGSIGIQPSSHADTSYAFQASSSLDGDVDSGYSFYGKNLSSGTVDVFTHYYGDAIGTRAINAYSFWSDEQGVFRIKSDNTFDSVYQAIPALYNPQFTKYTPGAANYERCIPGCQWNGNVAEYGTEKGGTGTLRSFKLIGTSMELAAITTATGFKPDTTTAHTALLQAYDTDTGPGYVTFGTLLNGDSPDFTIAPPAGGATVKVTAQLTTSGATPAVANVGANSCGTTAATIAGNNNAGEITVGATLGTQCRVTFTVAAPTRRVCTVTDATTTIATRATYVDSTHTDFLGAFVAGDIVAYHCFAN